MAGRRKSSVLFDADFFKGKWWKRGSISKGAPHDTFKEEDEIAAANKAHKKTVSPSERVRSILAEGESESQNGDFGLNTNFLFCQLNVLCHFKSGQVGWKEMARWIKYEEKVESGNRWSKPHVATTSLHCLFDIRLCIAQRQAVVVLDMPLENACLHQIAESLTEAIASKKSLSPDIKKHLYDTLLKPHKHQHRTGQKAKDSNDTTTANGEPGRKKKMPRMQIKRGSMTSASLYHTYPDGLVPGDLMAHKPNKKLLKKIPPGTEAANILIGHCEFLDEPIMMFVRFRHPSVMADMTEVDLPTRFLFLAIGPTDQSDPFQYEEIGRVVGSLFSDKVFCQVAYKAKVSQDIIDGIDEFIDNLTVLPPSVWDPSTRLDPPEISLSQDKIEERLMKKEENANTFHIGQDHQDSSLQKTGRFFGGMVADIKRRYPLYWSDIRDGLHPQCIASVIFLYFACITPIVTFGGLLGDGTGNYMGTMETLLAGAICGTFYCAFSGQPLNIVGATGPMLIFETLLYKFCNERGIDFLSFRCWIGLWVTLILLMFVAFDLSALVRYITRFTEESFSVLISFIFIYESFTKVLKIWTKSPINRHIDEELTCYCVPPGNDTAEGTTAGWTTTAASSNTTEETISPYNFWNFSSAVRDDCINHKSELVVNHYCVEKDWCLEGGWILNGTGCAVLEHVKAVPDVFLLSCILFFSTFAIAFVIRSFRSSPFFPTWLRNNVSDFAVLIAILICVGVDYALGIDTPKLYVPSQFKTTRDDRNWVINPGVLRPWYLIILAVIPALLATILVFLDQQITAVIVNRKEHKFKKGHGYHLDLFVLAILIGLCSVLGLPWFVAATVRAVTHVRSLIVFSTCSAPGERPEMLGVREQRLTGVIIHVLIGVSTLFTGVLRYVPMAVLYGVFFYMGVTSLAGVQFVERILMLFMPQKYQPDHIYLRHVRTRRVHIFTCIQIVCMATMWAVKSVSIIAIAFPVTILAVCFVRKALDYIFTQKELYWLDHILPDVSRMKKEDTGDDVIDDDDQEVLAYKTRMGLKMDPVAEVADIPGVQADIKATLSPLLEDEEI